MDALVLAAQILEESKRARFSGRKPHTITITQAEADALVEIWGRSVATAARDGQVLGVPIQVLG